MASTMHVVNHSHERYHETGGNVGPDAYLSRKARKVYNRSGAKANNARLALTKKCPIWLRPKAKSIAR